MKFLKKFKKIAFFLAFAFILSCNTDDNVTNQDHELVGVWLRNDFSDKFEYKLYLNSDNTGMTTWSNYDDDGKVTSSSLPVEWSIIDNELNLAIGDIIYDTPYSFNSNGQLILSGLTDFPFNRLE